MTKIAVESAGNNPVAWMLKYTGELIPVDPIRKCHVYGAPPEAVGEEIFEENVYAATFLYKYDPSPAATKIIQVWLARTIDDILGDTPVDEATFMRAISEAPVHWSSVEYEKGSVNPWELWKQLDIQNSEQLVAYLLENAAEDGQEANTQLNQHFTRVRYGVSFEDKVNSYSGSKELAFRISSVGFNWYNTIYKTVADLMSTGYDIKSISIVRDTDGAKTWEPYKARNGKPFWLMPIDEFLAEEHGYKAVEAIVTSSIPASFSQDYWAKLLCNPGYIARTGPQVVLKRALADGYVPFNTPSLFSDLLERLRDKERRGAVLK